MELDFGVIDIEDYVVNKYDYISKFNNGRALVKNRQGLFGFIDEQLVEVIPCQFLFACDFSEDLALVKDEKNTFFIDNTGKKSFICSEKYVDVRSFKNDRAVVADGKHSYGYIDKTGKEIIKCQFYSASDFSEGLAAVDIRDVSQSLKRRGSFYLPVCPREKIRFINLNGEVQQQFSGNYRISMNNGFKNGIVPIELYGRYSEAIGRNHMIPAFVDKKGIVYSDKEKIDELDRLYQSAPNSFEESKNIDTDKLIDFCSRISCLGKVIEINAGSKEELEQKKKNTFIDIKNAIRKFERHELDPVINQEDYAMIKKIEKFNRGCLKKFI